MATVKWLPHQVWQNVRNRFHIVYLATVPKFSWSLIHLLIDFPAPSTASSLHSLGSASPPSSPPSSDSDHSLVDSRPFDSAEIINASQQQSQGRGWAGLWTAVTAVTAATVLSTAATAAGATGTTAAMEAVCKMAADQCLTKVSASILLTFPLAVRLVVNVLFSVNQVWPLTQFFSVSFFVKTH